MTRTITVVEEPRLGVIVLTLAAIPLMLVGVFTLGWWSGAAKWKGVAHEAVAEIEVAQTSASIALASANYWIQHAEEASETIDELNADLKETKADALMWELRAREASEALAASKLQSATPKPAPKGWQKATVSWYGPGFYGRKTASGAVLTEGMMNVAGHGLKFGTRIEFRYKGRTAIAVFNDRGPWIRGDDGWIPHPTRKFDLGPGTAKTLGFSGVGVVEYRIL